MPLERPDDARAARRRRGDPVVPELEAPRVDHDPRLFAMRPVGGARGPDRGRRRPRRRAGRGSRSRTGAWAAPSARAASARCPRRDWRSASEVVGPLRAVKDAARGRGARGRGRGRGPVADGAARRRDRPPRPDARPRSPREISRAPSRRGPRPGELRHRRQRARTRRARTTSRGRARIGRGEVVVCDFGGTLRLGDGVGYCSDTTRTVVTGEPERSSVELYEVLEARAGRRGRRGAPSGTPCEEVDRAGARADRRRRLRRGVHPPHRPRHRHRGARGPLHRRQGTRRRSSPATPSRSSRASTSPAGSARASRTSSSPPTTARSPATTPTTRLAVVEA